MKKKRGFTLIELLVCMGIIILISSILFANFPKFNQITLMNNAARDLSLALRNAQGRAVNVQITPGFPNANNYGIYASTVLAQRNTFVLFSDLDPDGSGPLLPDNRFIPGAVCSGECIKQYQLNGGVYIKAFTWPSPLTGCVAGSSMAIIYRRPDPSTDVSDSAGALCTPYGPFKIQLSSQDNVETRTIIVWRTGQVSITTP